ncbi:uncharacterized protein DNG_07835 [Cephalotrichum gorgonifer]|uniref:Uncharacterized protein n=1 Tax=Cephalotrichum gorgonifer TaxID=2041049 RepID=A0AAE8N414_9PEZI|nr:uncharacterized protein DNG_07835 [Cephalotrichum gorgonifer]
MSSQMSPAPGTAVDGLGNGNGVPHATITPDMKPGAPTHDLEVASTAQTEVEPENAAQARMGRRTMLSLALGITFIARSQLKWFTIVFDATATMAVI